MPTYLKKNMLIYPCRKHLRGCPCYFTMVREDWCQLEQETALLNITRRRKLYLNFLHLMMKLASALPSTPQSLEEGGLHWAWHYSTS
jgi:hypothetical protein